MGKTIVVYQGVGSIGFGNRKYWEQMQKQGYKSNRELFVDVEEYELQHLELLAESNKRKLIEVLVSILDKNYLTYYSN